MFEGQSQRSGLTSGFVGIQTHQIDCAKDHDGSVPPEVRIRDYGSQDRRHVARARPDVHLRVRLRGGHVQNLVKVNHEVGGEAVVRQALA